MTNRLTNFLAALVLAILLAVSISTAARDSLTFDEKAHIVAGYSYLTQKDHRLNPEHPPLLKDLAAIPLLFIKPNFPSQSLNWTQNDSAPAWWVQFDLGNEFLYESGNDPSQIIFWSRAPMILLLVVLAAFVFWWAKRLGGPWTGLGALLLTAFSPTLIAHGRLVTTDVGAALGVLMATAAWLWFLKNPSIKRSVGAGAVLGLALLTKFSVLLLIPSFALITIVYVLIHRQSVGRYIGLSILAGVVAALTIWPVYAFHISSYPAERQLRDTAADLAPYPNPTIRNLELQLTREPLLRPWAQYARGVLMANQRASFGNTTYFLGEVSASGRADYFPIIYFFKEPLALHLLTLIALVGLWRIRKNFVVLSFIIFVIIYWAFAIKSNLNIGVRHLLPTYPFIFILLMLGVKRFNRIAVAGVLIWYIGSSAAAFPYYLSYYNELAGGINNGYKIAVDSNYDWGQDFYRLLAFVQDNNISQLNLDYFGGEDPQYWLGDVYIPLDPKETPTGWLAISANHLNQYGRFANQEPLARAGKSIFIYKID